MRKQILIVTMCLALIAIQFQPIIVTATTSGGEATESDNMTDEEFNKFWEDFQKQSKERAEEREKQRVEEAKEQEALTANISPLLVDPAYKNMFIYQKRINDKILLYRYTGTRKDLESTDVRFFIPVYGGNRLAYVKGGTIDLDRRNVYFIDSNSVGGKPIKNGSVSTQDGKMYTTNEYGELKEHSLFYTQNPKYKNMIKEIFDKIDGDILYPSSLAFKAAWTLNDNYKLLMEPKYKNFLAGLAVKYKICDNSETTTMKAKLTLAVFYDVYNGKDKLVTYNMNDKARISRLEFYTLACKYFYGTKAVLEQNGGYQSVKGFMNNFDNKDYAPYYSYVHRILHRAKIPELVTSKKVLSADITKYEAMTLIYATSELDYAGNEEKFNEYKKKSILDYCSDIKKSQIMSYDAICKKYFGNERASSDDIYEVCIKNKIILDYDQIGLTYLIDLGVLTVDSKNRLNLFDKVTYNQAITFLMNYSAR